MGTKGRPRVSDFVKISIAYKVIQYSKRYNETPYKAWFRLIKHRAFSDLMGEHYKNKPKDDERNSKDLKSGSEYWVNRINKNFETQKRFYTKHIKKWVNKRSGIGSLKSHLNNLQ